MADEAGIPCCCGSGVGLAATAPIRPLAWEPPYAMGAALKKAKRQKKKKKEERGTVLSILEIHQNWIFDSYKISYYVVPSPVHIP